MKLSKRDQMARECPYCLRPFDFPLCAYNIPLTEKPLTIRDFPICWDIKECPYEKEKKEKEKWNLESH